MTITERGQTLLAEGRAQEAVDQFTKALALEARAQAYESLGRTAEAEADRRHLNDC